MSRYTTYIKRSRTFIAILPYFCNRSPPNNLTHAIFLLSFNVTRLQIMVFRFACHKKWPGDTPGNIVIMNGFTFILIKLKSICLFFIIPKSHKIITIYKEGYNLYNVIFLWLTRLTFDMYLYSALLSFARTFFCLW